MTNDLMSQTIGGDHEEFSKRYINLYRSGSRFL